MDRVSLKVERVAFGDLGFAAAKRFEFDIFGRANGYATAPDIAAGEIVAYQRWEHNSEFLVGRLRGDEPVAVIRLLRHDPTLGLDSFSTPYDFGRAGYLDPQWQSFLAAQNPSAIAELATQAVLPRFRVGGVIEVLWRCAFETSRAGGVRLWTVALVPPLFRWYRAMLPDAMIAIGRIMPDYIGSDAMPGLLTLDHPLMDAVVNLYDRRSASTLFAASAQAVGLVATS